MTMNVTIALADRYAAAKAAADEATKALDALKAEIKALGMETLHGLTCDVTLCLSEQMRLDQKKVAKLLTEEQMAACKSPVLVETIRVKAKGIAA
jgi:hypothetical protein